MTYIGLCNTKPGGGCRSPGSVLLIAVVLLAAALLPAAASADEVVGGIPLETVHTGTVTGDLWFDLDPAPDWGSKNVTKAFTLPAAAVAEPGRIAWARLYISAYCGHMQDDKTFTITNRLDGDGDGEYERVWPETGHSAFNYVEAGGNDNTALGGGSDDPYKMFNDHENRVTSDYFMWYNVTDLIRNQAVNVNVDTSGSFDGRIKVISLVVAYDDPSSAAETTYWVNQGHDVCSNYVEDNFGEAAVGATTFATGGLPEIDSARLTIDYMASNNGYYGFPTADNDFVYTGALPPESPVKGTFTDALDRTPDAQGAYSGVISWDVTGKVTGKNAVTLGYARHFPGTGNAAFYKIPLAILTVKKGSAVPTPTVPVADFSADPLTGSAPLTVRFTDNSTGDPTAWSWDFNNDGTMDNTTQSPVYTYTAPGTYTVNLTVTNAAGSSSAMKTITVTDAVACDLTIGGIPNPLGSAVFAREPNTIRVMNIKNNGPGASPATVLEVRSDDGWAGRVDIPPIEPGKNILSTFIEDPTVRNLAGGTVTYTAEIDPDNTVVETNEINNVRVGQPKEVKYNGYKGKRYWEGGSDVTTVRTYDLRGDIIHSFGDSRYWSGSFGSGDKYWTNYTVTWTADDLPLPGGSSVHDVWLYVPYCWDNNNTAPDGVSIDFNGVRVPYIDWYTDVSNFGAYADHYYGLFTYNVTPLFQRDANNTALFERDRPGKISPAGFTLAVVYEDPSAARKQIFVNEEFDILGADPLGYGTNETEATAYVPFSGMTIDTGNVARANLTTFVPWGDCGDGTKPGEGNLFFNNERVQEWVWNYGERVVGEGGSTQVAVDERDVRDYLRPTGNIAAIQGTETNSPVMVAAQAFLVVEYNETVPVANFTANVTAGEAPLTVAFTDASTGDPAAWLWDFGDNATSTDRNPIHTYTAPGTYTVNLTVTNAAGSNKTVKTDHIAVTAPAAPDLTVSTLTPNNGEVFSAAENTYAATITNIGTADAGTFAVGVNVSGATRTISVPGGLAAGANVTVSWTDETVRDAGDPVTVTVTADPENSIVEADEENNVRSVAKIVVPNGYRGKRWTGGEDIVTAKTYTVRGDLVYSSGTSAYLSASTGWTNETVTWAAGDLAVPANATIAAARLYVPYTWDKGPVFPANVTLTFNGVAVDQTAFYADEKLWGTSYPYGMTVYDVTGAFSTDGNTAVLANAFPGGGNVSVRGMLLAVVYDDGVTAPHTILMNEGFDLLYGGAAQSTIPEQATAYAPFSAVKSGAAGARLVTVAPGAGPTEGDLLFNDEHFENVWNYTGTTQIGLDDRDVTAFLAGENLAGFRSDADYMEAAAAFLVVTYPVPTGSIAITSTPIGAAVFLDGEDTGFTTNCLLTDVPAGDHVVTLTLDGYADASTPVTVAEGETATVDLTLTTLTGSLAVTSTPTGAAILIDGAETGKLTNTTLENLAVGAHTVTLQKDGYVDATAEVAIEYNATATLHLDLARALGSIAVTSAPEGAAIFLDGTDTGEVTNATLTVPAGEHTVTVKKAGYADATATVPVEHGKTVPVHFALTVPVGSIAVTSTPDGARIFLDGVDTGEVTNATLTGIPAGVHTVRVERDGYRTAETAVTVAAGETAEVAFDLAAPAITLQPGWNFVSTPKSLAAGADTIALFDAVDTAGHTILLYDGLNVRWEGLNSTDLFRPLDGIWIYANTTYTIPLTFAAGAPDLPPAKDLGKGWNAIGFSDTVPESAKVALHSLGDHWSTLIGFDAATQEYDVSIIRGVTGRHGDERPMQPMQGYWIFMNAAETLGSLSG